MTETSTITGTLSWHARETPDRPAVVCDNHAVNWRDLDEAVNRLAGHLAKVVPAGRGVALHLPNGPALVLLFLAACRAGREAQILDPSWPTETARLALTALAPGIVVSGDATLAGETEVLAVVDPHGPFASVADAIGAGPLSAAMAEPNPLMPFYVGFTSGSTGTPKGYRRHHRSWIESFRAGDREFDIGADDIVLAPGALTHSLFLYGLAHGLYVGATVILCRQFRPNLVNRLIISHGASVIYGVPTQLEMMIEAAMRDGLPPFASVRWILSSGAKWQGRALAELRRQFPEARFSEFYGASELSFVTVAKDEEDVPADSVGRPFAAVSLTIRDHLGRCLPPGEAGQVFVASPFLFMEYACGSETLLPRHGDAVSVGDIGMLDERGFLRLVGRASRMIITAGKNVHPEEIERVLEGHPAVIAAGVLGAIDEHRGERLVALLRLGPDGRLASSELISHARLSLPLYKIPRRFAVPSHWPMTSSGKTDFHALRQLWDAGACELLQ
ncbi:AMP-dependent synthetase [Bradyrhizobium nanningense]|uniref:AMP-dependent synthetase n=1 Tax=Bradyrhizobium nanningense TaxID=1325118 RepID=A0A4Q0S653_9BRAD|nr:AMP-binding protein [Bradyrhizobium nanningense]RXH29434.1 AMP-dependent synthetase [Bradyrhizobium nanningense]RXH34660.1 AMP-dependent synthetase [Bradyrhizobium nanningense]